MNNTPSASESTLATVFAKLRSSNLFSLYGEAFEGATGLPLSLRRTAVAGAVPVCFGKQPVAYIEMARGDVSEGRFAAALTLVKTFALQLSELAGRIFLSQQGAEPVAVKRAKAFIMENLDVRLKLDDVAVEVNVSPFYFCKLFKSTTGMTFTDFVNRQRVERAKNRLMDPAARVTEIAYDVGYQSLSQFNRSFHRIVGESPTQFRKRMGVGRVASAA